MRFWLCVAARGLIGWGMIADIVDEHGAWMRDRISHLFSPTRVRHMRSRSVGDWRRGQEMMRTHSHWEHVTIPCSSSQQHIVPIPGMWGQSRPHLV
jgi:hypothetical protein